MKTEIEKYARQLGGKVNYQGKTKTFFVTGTGVITPLKTRFERFGFKFEKQEPKLKYHIS